MRKNEHDTTLCELGHLVVFPTYHEGPKNEHELSSTFHTSVKVGKEANMADWSNVVEILSAILHGSSLEAIPDLCRVLNKR